MPEHGLHAVRPLCVFAETWLTLDGHPCILGDLPKLVCESFQYFFSALPLCGKASNSPHFDFNSCVELFSSHVPHSVAWCCYCPVPSSILEHRCWEYASGHMGHLIPHFKLKLLNKRICFIICTSYQSANFLLSIWCRSCCCLNHSRSLIVC